MIEYEWAQVVGQDTVTARGGYDESRAEAEKVLGPSIFLRSLHERQKGRVLAQRKKRNDG